MITTRVNRQQIVCRIRIWTTPHQSSYFRNDSGPPPIEAMPTRFDPDQIKRNKHFDNIF